MHWIGILFGVILIITGITFFVVQEERNFSLFVIGLGIASIALPFVAGVMGESKKEQEISEMFLEFSRNLAESVTTGTPISKSIVNMGKKNYGVLTPYIQKLSNQISLGIPVNRAFQTFAQDVDSPVIHRAVALISEAERAGGEIDYILESVATSISEIEKLKKERKAAISSLVVQGYIIFFIFIGIMIVMEFKILPLAVEVSSFRGITQNPLVLDPTTNQANASLTNEDLASLFLYLLLAQGFFGGFAIGKLAEGSLKAGIKHSFILMISSFLITTGVRLILN